MNTFDFWNFNANIIIAFSTAVAAISLAYIAVRLSEKSSNRSAKSIQR